MSEDEARDILETEHGVPRETMQRLSAFADLLTSEAQHQNLISKTTFDCIWSRHILDSAQLVRLAPADARTWLDLGTGAGFPGLIAAVLHPAHVTCVESRRLRVEFLQRAAEALQIQAKVRIICDKLERVETAPYDVISARAFAPLSRLFTLAERFAVENTVWVLPKGRNAKAELADAVPSWQGVFRLEESLTDPDAYIVIAEQVSRKQIGSMGGQSGR